jgi:hypothetical protein
MRDALQPTFLFLLSLDFCHVQKIKLRKWTLWKFGRCFWAPIHGLPFRMDNWKDSPTSHSCHCMELNAEPGQSSATVILLSLQRCWASEQGTRCLCNFEEQIYMLLCLPQKQTLDPQQCINDPFSPLFIVECSRFQLLAGDHATKNSTDAVTGRTWKQIPF